MAAIFYNGGVIRPIVAAVKSIASAVAIGSGAAVGREGPIIQIGSALGSTFGQIINLEASQRITLVAAGAGAGIAATFNTPLGGVLFVTELMLPEVSVNTFLPVATATGIATFVGRLFFGPAPAFTVPQITPLPNELGSGAFTLLLYVVLGLLMGVAAAAFVRGLHLVEDTFDKISNRYLRHMLGMLSVGVLIYALFRAFGHYYVEGVGYATIQAILNGELAGGGLLACFSPARSRRPRSASARARQAACSRPLSSWVRPWEAPSRLRSPGSASRPASRPSRWSEWEPWLEAPPAPR